MQFYKHKFTVWNFNGGDPLFESFIKEMPLNENQYKNQLFTERPVETAPVDTVKKAKGKIVYKEKEYKELCEDPAIDSADSSLDGNTVYLFKNDVYYQLEGWELNKDKLLLNCLNFNLCHLKPGVKESGFGKLTKFGKTAHLLQGFAKSSSAVMMCKEGRNRGFIYEFNTIMDPNSNFPIQSNLYIIPHSL